jgi:hypothetical protein
MQDLRLEEQQQLQQELGSSESLAWAGKPNTRVIFHPSDWYMIPFSLMWGGFAIFWEFGVTGTGGSSSNHAVPSFFMLWGIPFIVVGQYFIWGRFFYAAWKKTRIVYAITNQRILVLVLSPGRKVISSFIDAIPSIDKEIRSDGIGTLKFGDVGSMWGMNNRRNNKSMDGLYLDSGIPVFVDIDDAASVYSLVTKLRASQKQIFHS